MNSSNKAGMALVCTSALLFSSTSFAVEPGFTASVAAGYTTDDNLFREANGSSDTFFTVSPDLRFVTALGKHQLSAGYRGSYASYDKFTKENYNDHLVNLDLLLDLSKVVNINLIADYSNEHESRGTSNVATTGDVTLLDRNSVFAGFAFGADTAKMQAELDYKITNIDYTNNAQDTRDRRVGAVGVRALYNVSDKTKVFVEARQNDFDYLNSTRDSTETLYYAGGRWDITGKTTGEFKIGTYDKNFDAATETDGDGTSYSANMIWSPKQHSRFTLFAEEAAQESNYADSFYTSQLSSLGWEHDFSDRLALNVDLSLTTDEYSGGRKDDTTSAGLGVKYEFRRWLDFGLSYTNTERDSSDNTLDYTDNLVMFTATLLRESK